MYRKIRFLFFNIALTLFLLGIVAHAKKADLKKGDTSPSVFRTVKSKCDEIVNQKNYDKKVEKLDSLIQLIKSKVNQNSADKLDPYLAAWQNADYEFDFLKTLFVQKQSNEFINCDTIYFRLSENISTEIKKDLQPYIELATRVSKDLCSDLGRRDSK